MKSLLVLLSVLLCAPTLPAAEKPGLSRERLLAAYGHTRNAAELAKGGATKKKSAKAGADMSDDELRKEIGIYANQALFDFAKVPPLARIDIAAHLHIARLRLTTNRHPEWDEVRKRISEKEANADNLRKSVEAIHAALRRA